jgi:hypothetical protein
MDMYCLIIESDFVSTSDSFNNRVAHEPSFVELSLGKLTGSFVRLQPYIDDIDLIDLKALS